MTGGNDARNGAPDIAAHAAEKMPGPNPFLGLRLSDILLTLGEIGGQAVRTPMLALRHETQLAGSLLSILAGTKDFAPPKGDKRFDDAAWHANPFYRMYMQGYLAWSNALDRFAADSGLDPVARERARFVLSLMTDALAPTNTLAGNPAALKKAIDSGGKSVLEGFKNLLADMTTNQGMPAQVDMKAFQPGRNLGLSPGAVVWRNEVLELIQYEPATGEVYARPQLIVPPQINKFYVFDL